MKRHTLLLCGSLLAAMLAGCARAHRPTFHRASMLFDPLPTLHNAGEYSARTSWPTASTYIDDGEKIRYREQFYDYQGTPFYGRDYFIRRFTAVREGRGHR